MRAAALALLAGATGLAAWLVARSTVPQQSLSLRVLSGRGSETMQAVDRVGKTLTRMPDAQEIAVGRALAREGEAQYPRPQDLPLAEAAELARRQHYLEGVLATLVEHGRLRRPGIPYRARVLLTDEANAFALPGGHVYMTTALLDLLESEAEVAAVLGHEVAHVDLGHCRDRIQSRVQAERVGGPPLGEIAALADALWGAAFDDEQEAEADRQGVVYAEHAGYHPEAGVEALRRLAEVYTDPVWRRRDSLDREVEGMIRDALDDYFRTHPHGAARLSRLEHAVREQWVDLRETRHYVGRENRRLWVPRAERELAGEFVEGNLPGGPL